MSDIEDDVDEHPIIFNEWSINRILRDEKTQTRRVITPKPPKGYDSPVCEDGKLRFVSEHHGVWPDKGFTGKKVSPNLCGWHTGDILWVREAFRMPAFNDGEETPKEQVERGMNCWYYEATNEYTHLPGMAEWGRLRPAIHMPRELCRLRLRVEDVRVERVQETTLQDAEAEGIEVLDSGNEWYFEPDSMGFQDGRQAFRHVWEKIHGDGAWEHNDWVWVVEFSRIDDA